MLQTENNNLRQRIKTMQSTVETLTVRNTDLLAERAALHLSNMDGEQTICNIASFEFNEEVKDKIRFKSLRQCISVVSGAFFF